ncbi:MAG: aminodeoxychorismate synthase component I [Saccharospirillaceae bacterium]|nr:aminodeoxychorismate synthase component I [Saccharospirillaceae bacterium]
MAPNVQADLSGTTASAGSSAVLAFKPSRQLSASNAEGLQDIRRAVRQTPTTTQPEQHSSVQGAQRQRVATSFFSSGWAGYISYDAGKTLQNLPIPGTNDACPKPPLAEFFYYPLSLFLNFADDSCTLQNPQELPESVTAEFIDQLRAAITAYRASAASTVSKARQWHCAWNEDRYREAFNATQRYLMAGDCYQVNLAVPFYCPDDLHSASPASLLQDFNAPFSAYLRTPSLTLFSVSPERFIRIDGARIETRPIKGTIARGETPELDESNRQWLADSAKNRAENLMIVDLLRNDLSRSAEPFSVKVTKLFDIESHANVHHMVSTIVATRRPEQHAVDVIFDAFPGGSITGAPKRRAMEIIDEFEHAPRGAYCGVLGYFDDAGHADFNILIRTISATAQGAVCWGGGGVVMDSTWEDEWQEIHSKVGRILNTPL